MKGKRFSTLLKSRQPLKPWRRSLYERPSDINQLSEEFFTWPVKLAAVCPETALMFAVLEDAFHVYHKNFERPTGIAKRKAEKAKEWFFSDDSGWQFSFLPICSELGLNPRCLRAKLQLHANSNWAQQRD